MELQAGQVQVVSQARVAREDHPDRRDRTAPVDSQDRPDHPASPASKAHRASSRDHPAGLAVPASRDSLEALAAQDPRAAWEEADCRERLDETAHRDVLVSSVSVCCCLDMSPRLQSAFSLAL